MAQNSVPKDSNSGQLKHAKILCNVLLPAHYNNYMLTWSDTSVCFLQNCKRDIR